MRGWPITWKSGLRWPQKDFWILDRHRTPASLNIQEDPRHERTKDDSAWEETGECSWAISSLSLQRFVLDTVLLDWQVNPFTNQWAITPAPTMQPPVASPSPHLWALSLVAIKMTPFMRTIAFTADFRGTNFAQQPKQLKNALFQINEKICVFKFMSSQAFSQELLNHREGAFLILKYSLYLGASPYCNPRIPKHVIWSTQLFTSPEAEPLMGTEHLAGQVSQAGSTYDSIKHISSWAKASFWSPS